MIYKASAEAVPLSNQNSCLHIYVQALESLWETVILLFYFTFFSSVDEIMEV